MIGKQTFPLNILNLIMVGLFLISPVSTAIAIEFPSLKSLGLPSFKYGKLKRDPDINRKFKTYKILPDHRYYTSGRANIP